jgi:LacI family transcriptional regulator
MHAFLSSSKSRVTVKDIAARANVSIGTVDRVLHNRGEVRRETFDRVRAVVEELEYTPNLLAKSLALKKRFRLAALIPESTDNPYWESPAGGFNRANDGLKDYHTSLEIYPFDPGEEDSFLHQFDRLVDENPDGIILAPHFQNAALKSLARCETLKLPVVLIDADLESGARLAYFGQDARQSGEVAASLMHYGLPDCSTVLIMHLARNRVITPHMKRREQGFRDYFVRNMPGRCIHPQTLEADLNQPGEPGTVLRSVLAADKNIAGIFVTNSRIYKVALEVGQITDRNLLLVGYDLLPDNLDFVKKGIINFLIGQKPEQQGYQAVLALFNYLLTGKAAEPVNYSPIEIIIRENLGFYPESLILNP